MQQTRVLQGTSYYHNFLGTFPDIESLANAKEEEVLKVWQGLGYYSRARNMHFTAKTILEKHDGEFPADYDSLKKLKGIGDYTAAAIASIAFGLPYAVVDGNVYRVLSRLFGIETPIDTSTGKKEFYRVAQLLLDQDDPGESNQALMEFGAIHCLPKQPLCLNCPLQMKCHAFVNQLVDILPVKSKQIKQRARYLNYLYIHQSGRIFLEKRGANDIWRNMYQFPLIETPLPATPEEMICSGQWERIFGKLHATLEKVFPEQVHLLTHQKLYIRFFSVKLEDGILPGQWVSVEQADLARLPVPKPIEKFLQQRDQ